MEKEIIHLALRTGYSFKRVFGHMNKTVSFGSKNNCIGIADVESTFGHYYLEAELKNLESEIKPIYGARLCVVEDATEKVKPRGQFGAEYIFIAKNLKGLRQIYNLVRINFDNFYYRGNISFSDVEALTEDVIVIAENTSNLNRLDYIALTTTTPEYMLDHSIPKVAIVNNYFPEPDDFETYELFVGPRNSNLQTYPQHILSTKEFIKFQSSKGREKFIEESINNTHIIAYSCEHIVLEKAPMIKFKSNKSIEKLCEEGAVKKGIDIINDGEYKERYEREMKLIREREFDDYFLIVADMIAKAKKRMLVGPSRGSSAGSLVCYLLSITEIDPIEYDLLFERFIDVNRMDLPDIDIDFPDAKRQSVIKQLVKDYGEDKVKHIANVSTMQPKGAIGEFSKGLRIPTTEIETLKNSIIERSGGDSRAAFCMTDTFETTEVGKEFIKKYPAMKLAANVEAHPRHSSVHAAGIIVCNDPIHKFSGVSSRDNSVMVNKHGAEYLNLLKIDVLGLRTLSILEDCANQIGMPHTDFYTLPLDDQKTFDMFNKMRLSGIFQFEGHSLASLTRKMGIEEFNDIVAITALARPGALYSGGAARYVEYRRGIKSPEYCGELHKKVTQSTFGIVVFQEQILRICREIGKMSWTDVNKLRKALSKSLGEEFFGKYKEKFLTGAKENGYSVKDAEFIWNEVCYGGNYAFNKSHAVAYGLISYWSAYMKANYPLEFVVANLNHAKDDEAALKILRDAVKNEGVKYIPVDPDISLKGWSVKDGIIYGGLTNIKGIADKSAQKIINAREGKDKLTPSIVKKMMDAETPFDILYPCKHYWGDIYENHDDYGLSDPLYHIKDIHGKGLYVFIGKLKFKNVRDLNEYVNLQKRGGKVLTDHTLELAIKVEDDTDSIMVGVDRFSYERFGKDIAEYGIVDEDWFLIYGEIKTDTSRYIRVKNIAKLKQEMLG